MTAIVYTSASGFTKKYAEMLSAKTGLPPYDLKQAKIRLAKGSDILYMGWLFAGGIKGCNQALKRYAVKAVCAVGMGNPPDADLPAIKKRHDFGNAPLFYLQGGFDIRKLRGLNKFLMKRMSEMIVKQIESKPEKTPDDAVMLDMVKNGRSMVKPENLVPVAEWVKANS